MKKTITMLAAAAVLFATAPASAQQFTGQLNLSPQPPFGLMTAGAAAGVRLNNQLTLRLGLSLGSNSEHSTVDATSGGTNLQNDDFTTTGTGFGAELQAQYYFSPTRKGALVPYGVLKLGKVFYSTTYDGEEPLSDIYQQEFLDQSRAMADDLKSPFVGTLGVGGEYFINESFSFGFETGLRFSYASGGIDIDVVNGGNTQTYVETQSNRDIGFPYGLLSFNMHLGAGGGGGDDFGGATDI